MGVTLNYYRDDLINLLKRKNVSVKHIQSMMETKNESSYPLSLYYDFVLVSEVDNKCEYLEYEGIVDVSKIKGLHYRGTNNLSWFNHAIGEGTWNINGHKCNAATVALEKVNNLEDFHEYFMNHPLELTHYEEEDKYFVNGDSTHRTLFAKLTDCPCAKARILVKRLNPKKLDAYKIYQKQLKRYNVLFQNLSFTVDHENHGATYVYYKEKFITIFNITSPNVLNDNEHMTLDNMENWTLEIDKLSVELDAITLYKKRFLKLIQYTPRRLQTRLFNMFDSYYDTYSSFDPSSKNRKGMLKLIALKLASIDKGIKLRYN